MEIIVNVKEKREFIILSFYINWNSSVNRNSIRGGVILHHPQANCNANCWSLVLDYVDLRNGVG